jgi:hypothetical protein
MASYVVDRRRVRAPPRMRQEYDCAAKRREGATLVQDAARRQEAGRQIPLARASFSLR